MKQLFKIISAEVKRNAILMIDALPLNVVHTVEIREARRRPIQNDKMWATLTDISDQVSWYGQKLTKEEWKDIFTAAVKKQNVVPGIDGGFVVLGAHTSKMSVSEMAEVIECAVAFGCQHEVKWKDPKFND